MNVEELAPHMGPAGRFGDAVAGVQLIETGVAIGVDDTGEVFEVGARMLALAVGRVAEQRRRRALAREGPLVADIDPQPAGLGLAGTRRQHRRVVDMQAVRRRHFGGERIDQRRQGRGRSADPAGQGRGLQADTLACVDLGLAVQRQVIVVFGHDDVGQQPGAGATTGNRVIGRRCGNDRVASAAGQLLAQVPHDLEAARHVIEGLGHILADPPQRVAAARTAGGGAMHDLLARQVIG
jgi:hypothetical protein